MSSFKSGGSAATAFNGPEPLYKLRGGDYAVITGVEGDHVNGVLLPSEMENSWDAKGLDLDGQSKFDLMYYCPLNGRDGSQWFAAVESIRHPEVKR